MKTFWVKRLTSIVHILSPETDNSPSWISGRERMTVENISWSISTKECCRPRRGLNPRPPGLQSDKDQHHFNSLIIYEPANPPFLYIVGMIFINTLFVYFRGLYSVCGWFTGIYTKIKYTFSIFLRALFSFVDDSQAFTHRWNTLFVYFSGPLRKHAYWNILKSLPPKIKIFR